jgi:hypothetical protein
MAKKTKKTKAPPKKLNLPNDEPLHIDMPFEELMKLAVNTPTKKSKPKK